jgi:hypothetical protein
MQLPLNVSPVSASFFGLERLGILLVLSVACSLLACLLLLPPTRLFYFFELVALEQAGISRSWLARGIYVCLLGWSRTPHDVRSLSSASLLLSAKLK